MDSSCDCEIVSPGEAAYMPNVPTERSHDSLSQDDIVMIQSNLTNPAIQYPHSRSDCGLFSFVELPNPRLANQGNKSFCPKCYCYVCQIPASECTHWISQDIANKAHCNAYGGLQYWQTLRKLLHKTNSATKINNASPSPNQSQSQNSPSASESNYSPSGSEYSCSQATSNNSQTEVIQDDRPMTSQGLMPPPMPHRRRFNPYANRRTSNESHDVDGQHTGYKTRNKAAHNQQPQHQELGARQTTKDERNGIKEFMMTDEELEEIRLLEDANKSLSENPNPRASRDMRIPEILARNFNRIVSLSERGNLTHSKIEGDLPSVSVTNFHVEGIKIGWPYPKVMGPQRQMALHIIKGLKSKKHVILESPTGTGKSAAILCSVLAWQRWHKRQFCTNPSFLDSSTCMSQISSQTPSKEHLNPSTVSPPVEEVTSDSDKDPTPKIIYCSRTHSQVAQLVDSLRKTPYRPKMAILGSREHLCIHQQLRTRDSGGSKKKPTLPLSVECRSRVRNSEMYRKRIYFKRYDDDDPPIELKGDNIPTSESSAKKNSYQSQSQAPDDAFAGLGLQPEHGLIDGNTEDMENPTVIDRSKKPMCSHYRQLTASRTATLAHAEFRPNPERSNVMSGATSGPCTKMGSYDIEDLVAFGVNPQVLRNVALYRPPGEVSFGMKLERVQLKNRSHQSSRIGAIQEDMSADQEGTLKVKDVIVRVNGVDVTNYPYHEVVQMIKATPTSKPLILDVSRDTDDEGHVHGHGGIVDTSSKYSPYSACPYYLSQTLAAEAEIVFCPYNYVLDPGIRKSMNIELRNSVIILDEAHNIEDTLRESGSGSFSEMELYDMAALLLAYARSTTSLENVEGLNNVMGADREGKMKIHDVAHSLLVFVEKIVEYVRDAKRRFEENPGISGAAAAIRDWKKFKTPDDKVFEVDYFGPNNQNFARRYDGLKTTDSFFKGLDITGIHLHHLRLLVAALEQKTKGNNGSESIDSEGDRGAAYMHKIQTVIDRIGSLINLCGTALDNANHYFVSSGVTANGSLEFASGELHDEGATKRRFRATPKKAPLIRSHNSPTPQPPICSHKDCPEGNVRHGEFCDGSTPHWEGCLSISLLSPGILMDGIASECRSLILASGTLAPIPSMIAELNLMHVSGSSANCGLQTRPKPLEANHVIDLDKQLLALSIGRFPDGSSLIVSYKNYSQDSWLRKLGHAIATVVHAIPYGGVLIFLPSYSLLRRCSTVWQTADPHGSSGTVPVWERLIMSKKHVIVEPTGGQEEFELAKDEYKASVATNGGCVLLAVYRGKMSEGISFNDNNARCVICVGVPLPNYQDRAIVSKRAYNDEQRALHKRTDLLSGNEWYKQQAYRALAQALGRCIRHCADYGVVVLMDERHCDDGSSMRDGDGLPDAHRHLPKWMRHHVKNLDSSDQPLHCGEARLRGGWSGLSKEFKRFFETAAKTSLFVLDNQRRSITSNTLSQSTAPEGKSSGKEDGCELKPLASVSTNNIFPLFNSQLG